ncbi:Hypothetical predicted protein [Mytilus galloprovincialis]|uniref:Peptidase A2 domain-containing protein n=1 Tax=Mytilus galloprovincialis TaxID=29158 RepID=A0A8B6EEF5_MYTGA|nr:Hypothetical predicted protein [Mytilus galloprovincialis]
MRNEDAESAASLEMRNEDDESAAFLEMKNEDAESADFDIDILFKESKMQKENIEQEKDLSSLSPVRETKIVEVMSELTSEQSTSTAVMTPMMKTEKMDSRQQSSCVIQIDRVRSATIKVPISINGQVTKAVLDTGAEVTVLNSSLYFGIPEEKRPILKKATRNLVVAEAGKSMETHGIAMMNVKLGNHEFSWDMYIAPIGDSILLGCDIVDELDITINSKKGIHVDGKWIECYTERKVDDKIARVVLTENVTVPANYEKILFGGSYNTDAIDTRYTMLKSVVEDNRKIMVTQILVDPFEKVIPFRLVNMEDHPVQLNLKMNINLTDEPVRIPDEWNSTIRNCKAENSWKMNDKCRNEAEIPALPDHLKDLLKLDRVQQRYSVTRRELLAAVTFMQQFRHYLLRRKCLLRTDHGSLRWIFAFKDPQGQLARWIESLSQCNFYIQHRPGTKHSKSDAMSRNSNENDLCIHLKEGNLDSSCAECIEWKQEWLEFRKKVDNLKNLTDKPMIRNVTQSSDGNCSSWLTKYTEKEMSTFQKEDPDYSFLHKWMNAGETPTPDRDKCASFSPAVRHYWLNWSNLVRIGGVIYQKWREVKSELDHLQLLVSAVIKKVFWARTDLIPILISCHDTAYSGHFGIKKIRSSVCVVNSRK